MPRLTRAKKSEGSKYSKRRRARRKRAKRPELTPRELAARQAAGRKRRNDARKARIAKMKAEYRARPHPFATDDTQESGSVPDNVQEVVQE